MEEADGLLKMTIGTDALEMDASLVADLLDTGWARKKKGEHRENCILRDVPYDRVNTYIAKDRRPSRLKHPQRAGVSLLASPASPGASLSRPSGPPSAALERAGSSKKSPGFVIVFTPGFSLP